MNLQQRLTFIDCETGPNGNEFARDVASGLTSHPKHLSSRFLYDREGSNLFEAICELPEYYLMRVERSILQERAAEIARLFREKVTLVELGSGSAAKTRILIDELIRRQGTLRFVPVDISRSMLEESSLALLRDCPALEIVAVAGEYHDGLRQLSAENGSKLILWLGSNVGNLDRDEAAEFLRLVSQTMSGGDRLLIGIDLRKDPAVLLQAYDDSEGITAQFSKNILARINRELGGHFDLNAFEHWAVYREQEGCMQMYLVSRRSQRVAIDGLGLEIAFETGEAIHTENSFKYSLEEIQSLGAAAGLCLERQWLDGERRFSVNIFRRILSPLTPS